ncbi:MAG: M48 family metallopeptidase [Lysobacterales bacterium]|jgi:STE24 endopeptidase
MRTIQFHGTLLLLCALLLGSFTPALAAEDSPRDLAPGLIVPDAARPGPKFNAGAATRAYIDLLTPEQRAQSDAYFEGGYWISLWDMLVTVAVAALLLFSRASSKLRDWAEKVGRRPFLHTAVYALMFIVAVYLLTLPWMAYVGFFREHQYGLATQNFPAWLADSLKELGVNLVIGAPAIALLYTAVRRAGAAWWAWAGAITAALLLFVAMIAPVFIAPLFNTYKPLAEGPLRDSVLSMARAYRIPADNVYVFDASRQTTRISANVSGMFGTTRISLNDNLLNGTSAPEIRAVMGHEMGHYLLNHGVRLVIYIGLVLTLGFLFLHLCFDAAVRRFGARWGVTGRGDPAGLPLAMALLAVYLTLAQPVLNSITRSAEAEADRFGLAAAAEPYGFATAAMRLSTYRKIHPGKWEELIFYDHPSGYNRVFGAMTWLKEHQDDPRLEAQAAQARRGAAP